MIKKYEYLIFIDTEFVSSKDGNQPFQVGMLSYHLNNSKMVKLNEFNAYIRLRKGIRLNKYAKLATGIDEETLNKFGLYAHEASLQIIDFVLNYDLEKTLIVGWDPINDKTMIHYLLNYNENLVNVESCDWLDLVGAYAKVQGLPIHQTPSLVSACEAYDIKDLKFHDAYDDAYATALLCSKLIEIYGEKEIIYDKTREIKKINEPKKKKYVKVRSSN